MLPLNFGIITFETDEEILMGSIVFCTAQKDEALKLLPEKTTCSRSYVGGFTKYVIELSLAFK